MIRIPGWGEECIVCGKGLPVNDGATRIPWQNETVSVCGPSCADVFRQNPDFYKVRSDSVRLLYPNGSTLTPGS